MHMTFLFQLRFSLLNVEPIHLTILHTCLCLCLRVCAGVCVCACVFSVRTNLSTWRGVQAIKKDNVCLVNPVNFKGFLGDGGGLCEAMVNATTDVVSQNHGITCTLFALRFMVIFELCLRVCV